MKEPDVITGLHSMGVSYKRILELFVFNEEHPLVWKAIEKRAQTLLSQGVKHISVKGIWEDVRKWAHEKERLLGKKAFELDNNLTSTFARLLILKYRNLEAFIELRELKQKEAA